MLDEIQPPARQDLRTLFSIWSQKELTEKVRLPRGLVVVCCLFGWWCGSAEDPHQNRRASMIEWPCGLEKTAGFFY